MKIAIDFDDFSPKNTNFSLLEKLREHYPDFKVTMFAVAWDIRFGDTTPITQPQWYPYVKAVKESSDWLTIAIHGLTHAPMEFAEVSYKEAWERITVAEKMHQNRGIKYTKIFKAPQWEISPEGEKAARDLGFTVLHDHYYNWNLADEMPKDKGLLIAHGHVQNVCGNGIEESMDKLMALPEDVEFITLEEALNEQQKT